ncbi:MAG: OmpA family protein [Cellvibrionales bacterium]|nr:OmpA family protein [Cellvibrionales bacterium]
MKKRMNSLIPKAVGACVLASVASSQAFLENSSFYLVPSVGYHYTDEMDHYDKLQKKNETYKKIEFDDGPVYGISFGFQTTAYTAIEFAYNYSNFDIVGKQAAGGETKYETTWHYVHVDALYYFNDIYQNDFSFYIPIGLGWVKNDPDVKNNDAMKDYVRGIEDTVFNFGIGAQYMFGDIFGIRGDIRGLYGFSQENFDAIAQVGLVFRFGVPVPVGMAADDGIKSADIRFKLNSTQIINPNDPDILALVDAVKNNPNANIKILAYSDKSGASSYNMKLSQRRADSLKNMLVNNYGVDPERVYTKAFGDQDGMSRSRHAVAIVEY